MGNEDLLLREHLLYLLKGGGAHTDYETALEGVPSPVRGRKPEGCPHSLWELLEHMRIAQWDILRFSVDPNHVSPEYPDGYWPKDAAPPDESAWDASVQSFLADLSEVYRVVEDESTDLFMRIGHGTGQTVLREALLVADHNAYHLGQFVLLRKLLGSWE